ncbi:hypothetical protein WH357_08845 [Enterobacter ludwigii]
MDLGWEDLINIQHLHWKFKDSNRILEGFNSFKIYRNDKLSLVLELIYKPSGARFSDTAFFVEPARKEGEVYITDGHLILENIFDENVVLEICGISLANTNITNDNNGTTATITCSASTIKKTDNSKKTSGKENFTIDWITNLDIGNYTWSSWIRESKEKKITRNFQSNNKTISFVEKREGNINNSKCCCIEVNGLSIFFGHTECPQIDKKYHTGFILYSEECDTEFRKKIRNALSFILGCKLVHVSSVLKDENYNSIEYEIHTQFAINELYHFSFSLPPSPLHPADAKYMFLGEDEIGLMVQKIINSYDDYDFSHFSWLYWHAVASPLHLKGVGFGATLEFVQRKFIEKNAAKFNTKLVDKSLWKPLHQSLSQILIETDYLNEDDKKLFLNKLSNLNQTPQSILTNRFYEILELSLGALEIISFKQRNNSAHGNKSDDSEVIPLIREVKILRILCNRIILRIYNLSDLYNDFYSFGFPTRYLQDSITDQTLDV